MCRLAATEMRQRRNHLTADLLPAWIQLKFLLIFREVPTEGIVVVKQLAVEQAVRLAPSRGGGMNSEYAVIGYLLRPRCQPSAVNNCFQPSWAMLRSCGG